MPVLPGRREGRPGGIPGCEIELALVIGFVLEPAGDEAGEHGEDNDSDDPVATLSHRAIPTWEEAIKFVIAPNLEARAKHPNGGQQHRGSRRPRGDRSRRSN